MNPEPIAESPLAGIEEEMAALLKGKVPTNAIAYRAFEFSEHIRPRLVSAGFDARFCVDAITPTDARSREQHKAKKLVEKRLRNEGAIIALCGERGLGKTTIAAQIACRIAWEDWQSVFEHADGKRDGVFLRTMTYKKLTGIVSKLKALYGDFGTIEAERLEALAQHYATVNLLVIDELQECGDDSRHKDRILTDIIDRRYAGLRDTILITNQTAHEFQSTTNASILSRLNEHGEVIVCKWESFR